MLRAEPFPDWNDPGPQEALAHYLFRSIAKPHDGKNPANCRVFRKVQELVMCLVDKGISHPFRNQPLRRRLCSGPIFLSKC